MFVICEAVHVAVLTCKEAGAAWSTNGVGHKALGKAYAIVGDSVQVRGLYVTGVVTTHHLGGVVVRHDVNDVVGFLQFCFGLRLTALQRNGTGTHGTGKC